MSMSLKSESGRAIAFSLGFHVALFALLLGTHRRGQYDLLSMPGTKTGTHLMLTYSAGAPTPSPSSSSSVTSAERKPVQPLRKAAVPDSTTFPSSPPKVEAGSGTSGDNGLGEGDIKIALPQVHPRPEPDLSPLHHGFSGNIVVDVTIDETGRITNEVLIKGIASSVDQVVLESLKGWTFSPATRNDVRIPSEQEIVLHYDRS